MSGEAKKELENAILGALSNPNLPAYMYISNFNYLIDHKDYADKREGLQALHKFNIEDEASGYQKMVDKYKEDAKIKELWKLDVKIIHEKARENKLKELIKPTYKKKNIYREELLRVQRKTDRLVEQHNAQSIPDSVSQRPFVGLTKGIPVFYDSSIKGGTDPLIDFHNKLNQNLFQRKNLKILKRFYEEDKVPLMSKTNRLRTSQSDAKLGEDLPKHIEGKHGQPSLSQPRTTRDEYGKLTSRSRHLFLTDEKTDYILEQRAEAIKSMNTRIGKIVRKAPLSERVEVSEKELEAARETLPSYLPRTASMTSRGGFYRKSGNSFGKTMTHSKPFRLTANQWGIKTTSQGLGNTLRIEDDQWDIPEEKSNKRKEFAAAGKKGTIIDLQEQLESSKAPLEESSRRGLRNRFLAPLPVDHQPNKIVVKTNLKTSRMMNNSSNSLARDQLNHSLSGKAFAAGLQKDGSNKLNTSLSKIKAGLGFSKFGHTRKDDISTSGIPFTGSNRGGPPSTAPDDRVALQVTNFDLKNIENVLVKMNQLSDVYRGEELREKYEILEKVYFYLKKEGNEPNFFLNFKKKYELADGPGYKKDPTLRDVEFFSEKMQDMYENHERYLNSLLNDFNPKQKSPTYSPNSSTRIITKKKQ